MFAMVLILMIILGEDHFLFEFLSSFLNYGVSLLSYSNNSLNILPYTFSKISLKYFQMSLLVYFTLLLVLDTGSLTILIFPLELLPNYCFEIISYDHCFLNIYFLYSTQVTQYFLSQDKVVHTYISMKFSSFQVMDTCRKIMQFFPRSKLFCILLYPIYFPLYCIIFWSIILFLSVSNKNLYHCKKIRKKEREKKEKRNQYPCLFRIFSTFIIF